MGATARHTSPMSSMFLVHTLPSYPQEHMPVDSLADATVEAKESAAGNAPAAIADKEVRVRALGCMFARHIALHVNISSSVERQQMAMLPLQS